MHDARTFLKSLEFVRMVLEEQKAEYAGEYELHDTIFAPTEKGKTIDDIYLRLRHEIKNLWLEKDFLVTIKNTNRQKIGKASIIAVRMEFDTKQEAEDYINQNWSDKFKYDFEFHRIGWQYNLGKDQIDLEDIEGNYSIEVKSPTEEGVIKLLKMLNIEDVIEGPAVVTIKNLLGRSTK